MAEPVFFVIEPKKGGVGEFPAIYYDRLPTRLTYQGQVRPIYVVRLDLLDGAGHGNGFLALAEDGQLLVRPSLDELYAWYFVRRHKGTLPHNVAAK